MSEVNDERKDAFVHESEPRGLSNGINEKRVAHVR